MRRHVVPVLGLALALVVGGPAPADAHTGPVVATDYRADVTRRPHVPGLRIRLLEGGGRIELRNRTTRTVFVLGYEDEPYLRITPDAVYENRRSPAVYLNATRTGGKPVPRDAVAGAKPRWVRIGGGGTTRWHDHRLHWMASDPPEVRARPGSRHRVASWRIPLRVGGDRTALAGTITYVPGPPWWPSAIVAAAAAGAAAATGAIGPAVGVAAAADAVRVWAVGRPGPLDVIGWALVAVAVAMRRRRIELLGAAGIVLAVAGGVLEWSDLGRSQLGVPWPGLVRVAIPVCAGLGLGAAAAAVRAAGRPPARPAPRPAADPIP